MKYVVLGYIKGLLIAIRSLCHEGGEILLPIGYDHNLRPTLLNDQYPCPILRKASDHIPTPKQIMLHEEYWLFVYLGHSALYSYLLAPNL